jgi:hypothetical protein
MQAAIDAAPADTSGLVIEPWAPGEVYGVAADWAQASCPVFFYGPTGWEPRQYQVADFRHRPRDHGDEDEAADLIDDAVEF